MHIKQILKTGVAGLALLFFCGIARAADDTNALSVLKSMSLEDLADVRINYVVAASKYEQKTTEAPASVSIITSEEIKRYGYRTLADVLESLQGFNVSSDRNYAYLGVRGFSLGDDNSRVLLLIDGHRINNNLTDSAFIGTEFLLDVDLIDRVEVIRGPGSVLYGNNAFFGVINVITRKGGQVNGVEASGEYAGFDTYKIRATIGKSFTNGVEFLLSGTYYDSSGPDRLFYPQFTTQNNGVAQDMDGESYESLFSSLSYRDFTLEGGFIHREKVDPTAPIPTAFNDPRSQLVDERSYVDLKYAHDFPGVVDVTARVYYDRTKNTTGYPFSTNVGGGYFREVSVGECWGTELQLNKLLFDKHMITVGAEYRDDFDEYDQVFAPGDTNYSGLRDVHTSRQNDGVFAQGDFALLKELHLDTGVRYDQFGNFSPFYSPRVALIYNPLEKSTFKAIYGTAFRAPSFEELLNQNIQPEEITSYELDYEQGIGQHLNSSLSIYYNHLHNLIFYDGGTYGNVDADSRGVELALEGKWANDVRLRASYSLQRTENLSGGMDFPDSPESLVKLNVSVPVFRQNIFAGLEFQYVSSRNTVYSDPNTQATLPGADAPGYSIVNFTLFSKDIVKNLEVSASVYNLLNESYADPSTINHIQDQIEQDGRSFRLKLTYRF
jgi:iron complex outermembrane receptor protein